jgi:dihydroorotate dehydrogenase electron transfer subunit
MPMLAAVATIARSAGVPSYIAVEEAMACGVGVCMTCVLPVRPRGAGTDIRMARACTEGPVFPGDAVQFDLIGKPPVAAAAAPVPTTVEAPI